MHISVPLRMGSLRGRLTSARGGDMKMRTFSRGIVGLTVLLLVVATKGAVKGRPAEWPHNRYGQQEDPIQRAKEAVQASPKSAQAYFELGTALQKSERRDGAITALAEAVRLRPDFREAYLALASLNHRPGRYAMEVVVCKEALKQFPNSAEFLEKLAAAYARDGNFEAGIPVQSQLIQDKPQDSGIMSDFAWMNWKAGHYSEAVTAAADAIML